MMVQNVTSTPTMTGGGAILPTRVGTEFPKSTPNSIEIQPDNVAI
jgi:hypothetical protein